MTFKVGVEKKQYIKISKQWSKLNNLQDIQRDFIKSFYLNLDNYFIQLWVDIQLKRSE